MKKLFCVLAIAALVSCNSGGDDKTAPAADTTAVTAPAPEVAPVVDTAAAMVKDTAAVAK